MGCQVFYMVSHDTLFLTLCCVLFLIQSSYWHTLLFYIFWNENVTTETQQRQDTRVAGCRPLYQEIQDSELSKDFLLQMLCSVVNVTGDLEVMYSILTSQCMLRPYMKAFSRNWVHTEVMQRRKRETSLLEKSTFLPEDMLLCM